MEQKANINNILQTSSDYKILDDTLRYINKFPSLEYLPSLIDFIIKPPIDNSFLNLKVLAIKILSKLKSKNAVSALLFCLNDKNSNYKIRLSAAEALGKIGDKNAFEPLSKIIQDEKEESVYIKESAVTALGMLGDERAVDVFSSIINTKEIFKNKFAFLKEKIMEAMSKLDVKKNKKALEIIKNSLYDPSSTVRITAIETLMNSDISDSFSIIYDVLKYDDDIEVKKNALTALYNLSDRRILDEIIKEDWADELKEYSKKLIKEYEK